jgi:diguanylate cyclase
MTRRPLVSTALLTLIAGVVAVAVTQLALSLVGGGDRLLAAAAAMLCAVLITPPIAWPLLRMLCDVEAARAQLDILATRDELTGVHNRRQFLVLADREWSRCRRYEMTAAMLMIDVDLFKRVNDEHGHLAGDLMLREIARAAGDTLRQPDLLGRFGGEEFVVFLPHADILGAIDAAERIRARVGELSLEWRGQAVRATVSVGVAALDMTHESLSALIHDADLALYAAKDAGRNCVRTVPPQARERGVTNPVVTR